MIISASRRTDIPSFYSDWFMNRLKDGFVLVKNPFNAKLISKIFLDPISVECIVFWTKNSAPILDKIELIETYGFNYYFQFTINAYNEEIECNVPRKKFIITEFQKLSKIIGKHRVIWRYDPIILTPKYNTKYHLKWFEHIAMNLCDHTEKCVISFVDIYKKCERNLKNLNLQSIADNEMFFLAKNISKISNKYGIKTETCSENVDFSSIGVSHGKCIDDELISRIVKKDISKVKDKNQRDECGCVESVDIGVYNTCLHGCKYCYANFSQNTVLNNYKNYDLNSPLLCGKLVGDEKITTKLAINKNSRQFILPLNLT